MVIGTREPPGLLLEAVGDQRALVGRQRAMEEQVLDISQEVLGELVTLQRDLAQERLVAFR